MKDNAKLIIGNWKMNMNLQEACDFFKILRTNKLSKFNWAILPSSALIIPINQYLKANDWQDLDHLGLQNFYPEAVGAFTGENSLRNFEGTALSYLLIGHSERRMLFGEENDFIKSKLLFALNNFLGKIVFVFGETAKDRAAGSLEALINAKVYLLLKDLSEQQLQKLVIAYEPIWSIGTGKLPSTAEIEKVFQLVKTALSKSFSLKALQDLKIIYGGSIDELNYKVILDSPFVDGLLIGGTSLYVEKFIKIINHE